MSCSECVLKVYERKMLLGLIFQYSPHEVLHFSSSEEPVALISFLKVSYSSWLTSFIETIICLSIFLPILIGFMNMAFNK